MKGICYNKSMVLYHGSSKKFSVLKKSQATKGECMDVPKDELLDAIYLTPDLGFAIAIAAMPDGGAEIDDNEHTIRFEHGEQFDPEKPIFIYEIDVDDIPKQYLKKVDSLQYAVLGMDELPAKRMQEMKAEIVTRYYKLLNVPHELVEIKHAMKVR